MVARSRLVSRSAALLMSIAAVVALTGCSQREPLSSPSQSTIKTDESQAVAGTTLRVINGREIGELRLTEETGPDAGDPPYPACLTGHASDERVVNFDLNWAGVNFGEQGSAPAVSVTIAGPDGAALIAEIPQPNPPNRCKTVRSFVLTALGKGWQLVYGMTLREPSRAKLAYLWVTVDRHVKKIWLSHVCNQDDCFQGDPYPPVLWTSGTPYSPSLTL